ncbi:hypothetical protein HYS03_01690 [Candidatus Woesebacteria bacterium]|nr:hypothetical protein [Candidatus Woesebacteria bacterium]QQG47031.1 MAG: hypothetical protein HY044_02730 [Candidatus Woesebacteria bacterium]
MLKKVSKQFSANKLLIILVFLGSLSWSLTMVKSGLNYSFGQGFWGPNGHDGIWHIALIKSLARGSFDMPSFAGQRLKNYHIGFDLLIATLNKVTSIPVETLYFQITPVILSILIGILTYKFVIFWKNSKTSALWATFFVYFGGSFGWIVNILRREEIGGESMFWSQQSISTLLNPPFALSIVILLLGLISLIKFQKSLTTNYLLLTTILFGILIEIKSYAGILALIALFLAGIWEFYKNKKINLLKIFFFSSIISSILMISISGISKGILIWQPFWFLETLLSLSDRFYWPKLYSAITTYKDIKNYLKLIPAYFLTFLIFWYGNLWTRSLKEIHVLKWLKNIKKIDSLDIFLGSVIMFGGAIPIFFVQKGTPWNTIQFFYYSLMFSGILAGVSISEFLKNKSKKFSLFLSVAIIALTVPTSVATLVHHYLPSRPPAKISNQELSALDFLSKQPQGVVLTYPFDQYLADKAVANPPRPLYLYDSTAYVGAFSGKPVFLEDQVNLDITGFDWGERRQEVENFLKSKDINFVRNFLKNNNIKYIYWVKPQRATYGPDQLGIKPIFENSEVFIYQVL